MNFSSHISKLKSKLARFCGILSKISYLLPESARLNYYYGFIYPNLIYNVETWCGTFSSHLDRLIVIHKRIVRIIAGEPPLSHSSPIFHDLKILKLYDIYRFQLAIYMFNARHNYPVRHSLNTQSRGLPVSSFHRLSTTQHSISFMGPKIWNELPRNLTEISRFGEFKRKLKEYFIDQYSQ